METENLNENNVEVSKNSSNLNKVTPLSKYLAMILFIMLPFLGGWIGYEYAPEKVVEVEKVVVKEVGIETGGVESEIIKEIKAELENPNAEVLPTETSENESLETNQGKASCLAENGLWKDVSDSAEILGEKAYDCYVPTSDAGKKCSTSSDCLGMCLAKTSLEPGVVTNGVCSDYSSLSGSSGQSCWQEVEDEVAQVVVCY